MGRLQKKLKSLSKLNKTKTVGCSTTFYFSLLWICELYRLESKEVIKVLRDQGIIDKNNWPTDEYTSYFYEEEQPVRNKRKGIRSIVMSVDGFSYIKKKFLTEEEEEVEDSDMVIPFTNGTQAMIYLESNCLRCIKYQEVFTTEEEAKCKLFYNLLNDFYGRMPLSIAKEMGCRHKPMSKFVTLYYRCRHFIRAINPPDRD